MNNQQRDAQPAPNIGKKLYSWFRKSLCANAALMTVESWAQPRFLRLTYLHENEYKTPRLLEMRT